MQTTAVPSSVSFFNSPSVNGQAARRSEVATPPEPQFVPLLQQDMNLRGMTERMLAMAKGQGNTVDVFV